MSLLDLITGGANENAQADLQQALSQMQQVSVPTSNDLQLSPLEQYAQTGSLTPAQMAAAQAGPSAFDSENLSAVPMSTMQQVLAQEGEIAGSNGMTPQEQAAIAQAEASADTSDAGQRGAIAQQFAAEGVPQSLISAALQNGTVGQNAEQEHMDALQGQAGAANNALTALSNEGALSGQMYNENATQANTIAAAQNALNQFNAANTQQANAANQATNQAANVYNTTTAQNVSNENVGNANQRQTYNQTVAPVTAAQLALQKAGSVAGVNEAQANQQTAVGQQNAGLVGGIIGAGATAASGGGGSAIPTGGGGSAGSLAAPFADGGDVPRQPTVPATAFLRGGQVPGRARVAGNSPANDTVNARLSPGEFVVPRTSMANPAVRDFLAKNVPTPRPPAAHPSDIASLMRAMSEIRGGAQ